MSLTLAEYADAVGAPVAFLDSLGLRDEMARGESRLVIPYYNPDGTLFRERLRLALTVPEGSKDKKFLWGKLVKPDDKTCLYGLQRLKEAREANHVVICEGESDSHVLWRCGYPAVGVPGAKAWNDDRDASYFDRILTIFIVIEPGQSGRGVLKWLGDSAIRKRARLVWFNEPKDPRALYLAVNKDPVAFRQRFDEMLQNADPAQADRDEDRKVTISMSESGLWLKDDTGKLLRISQPFEVLGRCRTLPGASGRTVEWGLLIRFQNWDGVMIDEIISGECLHGDLGALCGSLCASGFDVASDLRRRRLFAAHLLEHPTKDRVTLVQRAGWHRICGQTVFVLPSGTISAQPLPERVVLTAAIADRRQSAHETRGALSEWQNSVGKLARGHFLARLTISTALAGPLLRPAQFEGGGVHIYGKSGSGKTIVTKMGASVWRRGADLPSWRATANGLEGELARASDSFMPLDEIGQADGREIAEAVYMMTNAVGKLRMRRDTTSRDSLTWLTLILSSGETPIEVKLAEGRRRARAGHLVRLIDIKADRANGAFDAMAEGVAPHQYADECKRSAAACYGSAGPAFVGQLLARGVTGDDVRARVEVFVDSVLTGEKIGAGQAVRAAHRFGLIAAAGEMATEFGALPWGKGDATEAATWAFKQWFAARGGAVAYEERQAIAQVRRYVESYGESRFDPLSGGSDSSKDDDIVFDTDAKRASVRAGFRRGQGEHRRWLVFPEMWKAEVCEGLDPEFVAATLAKLGMLERGDSRNLAKLVKIKLFGESKPKRFYVLTPRLFEDGL
jgi:uncharacterized protein (DUF927 family)